MNAHHPLPYASSFPQAEKMADALPKTCPCAAPKASVSPTTAVKMPGTTAAIPLVKLQYTGKRRGAGCIDQLSHMSWLSQSALEIDSGHHRSCSGGRGTDARTGLFFRCSPFSVVLIQDDCCALFDLSGYTATEERRHLSLCRELQTAHLLS